VPEKIRIDVLFENGCSVGDRWDPHLITSRSRFPVRGARLVFYSERQRSSLRDLFLSRSSTPLPPEEDRRSRHVRGTLFVSDSQTMGRGAGFGFLDLRGIERRIWILGRILWYHSISANWGRPQCAGETRRFLPGWSVCLDGAPRK